MHRLSTAFTLGYYGCSATTAARLLAGEAFVPSDNDYDWLGGGIYFWQSNPRRALQFAIEKKRRERVRWAPTVVGAVIESGLCLDLTSLSAIDLVRDAHAILLDSLRAGRQPIPSNTGGTDRLLRKLDCAVIRVLHDMRESRNEPPIDTVSGVFFEGGPVYEGAGFQEKTHIQLCVRNPSMIKGVFRVPAQIQG